MMQKMGAWAFIIGVVIALIGGILSNYVAESTVISVLIVIGIIVGFLNVSDKETKEYILAAVSLIIVTSLGGQMLGAVALVGPYLENVLTAIMTFVIPATIIVALKTIYGLAQD